MMIRRLLSTSTQAIFCLWSCSRDNIVSVADYGSFSGTIINHGHNGHQLPHPVDAWLGIDYAAQPIGVNRFRPITGPPASFEGVKAAINYGKTCIQDSAGPGDQDEACLNFNVFRTHGVSLKHRVPVLVWIHGGSFNSGSWRSFDAASFVASSVVPIVVVTFHYRLNSLGFLPSALFDDEGLLNLGVRDQRFLLDFLQDTIASFGGDPDAVTIAGRSAGAHSVGIHYFHKYGEDAGRKPPFARALHMSGSVTARAFPNATYPLYVRQMDEFMEYLGCPQHDNAAAMACLRSANIDDIRDISTRIYQAYNPPLTWPFQPVQGGPLLEKFGSQSGYDETFHHVPVISITTSDEGKLFLHGQYETNDDFINYLHNLSPALTSDDLQELSHLYPDPVGHPDSPYSNSPQSTQYNRLSAAYSDYAYICPGQETAYRTSLAGVPTWKLRFNVNNNFPPWQGIPHTADEKYTWADPTVQYPDQSPVYHAYLASFVATGDPNKLRYPGSPKWPRYFDHKFSSRSSGHDDDDDKDDVGRPRLQLAMQPHGAEVERDNIRVEACDYWRQPERAPRLNK